MINRWLVLGLVVSGVGLSVYYSLQLQFNYNFESFFPTDDPELQFYQKFRETYESDNDYLLLAVENHQGVFNPAFLSSIDALTRQLRAVPDVRQVVSLTSLKQPVLTPNGLVPVAMVHPNQPHRYKQDSIRVYQDSLVMGSFVSRSKPAVALLIRHTQKISQQQADALVASIRQTLSDYSFDATYLAGKAVARRAYVEKLAAELGLFLGISGVLVVVLLALSYRSLWGILLPLFIVGLSALFTLGFIGAIGKKMDVLMAMLPSIIFVVGMSDVVHILSKYIEELRLGKDKGVALRIAFREVGMATFLTSLTTAVGFITLLTASIEPIREFGMYTAFGVFIAYATAFTVLPAYLAHTRPPAVARKAYQKYWITYLGNLFNHALANRKIYLTGIFGITLLAVFGMNRLQVNTHLIDGLPKDDPLKAAFLYMDNHFGGSKPFEMYVESAAAEKDLLSWEVMQEQAKLESFLRREYGIGTVISPITPVKILYRASKGGNTAIYELPPTKADYQQLLPFLEDLQQRPAFNLLTTNNQREGRISGRISDDLGSAYTFKALDSLQAYADKHINPDLLTFRITGSSYLIDRNNIYLVQNLLGGLAIALGVVALITGILYQSFRMMLIALVPNVIPLLWTAGMMGLLGIDLKLSTSIIFTIAFGIAVDDTIHVVSKFRIELQKGFSVYQSLKNTVFSTGKAIVITTLILLCGFIALTFSTFGGTQYTGLLVSCTLVFALVVDLTLLPVLIMLFYPRKKQELTQVIRNYEA